MLITVSERKLEGLFIMNVMLDSLWITVKILKMPLAYAYEQSYLTLLIGVQWIQNITKKLYEL